MPRRYWLVKCEPSRFSFDAKWKPELPGFVSLADLRANSGLADMKVVQHGQRLSIQPVTPAEWAEVCRMGGLKRP